METAERHNVWSAISAPFIGLAYVVVLPFAAIATVSTLLIKTLATKTYDVVANLTSFGWKPSEAYLSGKKVSKKKKGGLK